MVEKSLVDDEDWTDGDTVTAAELNNHAAEHNAMYDGTAGEVVAPVNNPSVHTDVLENGQWASVAPNTKAQLATTEDITLHVATTGDDSNDGTQSNPVATINEALSRVPKRVTHTVRIYIDYGDYTTQNGPRVWHHTVTPSSSDGLKIVGHDSSNPFFDSAKSATDITFGYGLSSGNRGTEELDVIGIHINGRWQVYDDVIRFQNCVFETGGGTSNDCIDGYKYKVVASGCEFRNAGRAFEAAQQAEMTLRNCTGTSLSGKAFSVVNGSVARLRGSDSVINNAAGNPNVDESSQVWGGPTGPNQAENGDITIPGAIDLTGLHNDEEPNIDLSEPFWRGYTDAFLLDKTEWNSETVQSITSGSGAVAVNRHGLEIASGSTSGSNAEAIYNPSTAFIPTLTFDKDRLFRVGHDLRVGTTNRTDYITQGRVQNGEQGYGFKIAAGDLQAVTHDGTAENTATLITSATTGNRVLSALLTAGSQVEYWVGGNPEVDAPDATLSANLPAGTSNAHRTLHFRVDNSEAASKEARILHMRVVQAP